MRKKLFLDTATAAGRRTGATRGKPIFGSPSQGITEASAFGWLDSLTKVAENATDVVNSVKGPAEPKPAAAGTTPAAAQNSVENSALGGLNPTIAYLAGAVVLVIALMFFLKR